MAGVMWYVHYIIIIGVTLCCNSLSCFTMHTRPYHSSSRKKIPQIYQKQYFPFISGITIWYSNITTVMIGCSQIRHVKEFDVGEHTQVSVGKKDIKCLLRVNACGVAETL